MTIKYPFCSAGVKMFLDDTIHDILDGNTEDCDIFVTIGNREIRIPIAPESYEHLERMLNDFVDIWETEY